MNIIKKTIYKILGVKFLKLVKIKSNDAKESQVMGALNIGNWVSIALVAVSCYVLCTWMLHETMKMNFFETDGNILKDITAMRVFYATLVGLVVGAVISSVTEYYTGLGKKPILKIDKRAEFIWLIFLPETCSIIRSNFPRNLITSLVKTFALAFSWLFNWCDKNNLFRIKFN